MSPNQKKYRRNHEWPRATRWDGYMTQDQFGGACESVSPELVIDRLKENGFVVDLPDVAFRAFPMVPGEFSAIQLLTLPDIPDAPFVVSFDLLIQ